METDTELSSSVFPATPVARELWWVAVDGAQDVSGGWLILADPGARGARQIQEAFEQAGISVLAAVDAASLHQALDSPTDEHREETSVAFRRHDKIVHGSVHEGSPAEVLLELRLQHPDDVLLLAESQDAAYALDTRMQALVANASFEGIRMDLRDEPRGKGAWGLALIRSR